MYAVHPATTSPSLTWPTESESVPGDWKVFEKRDISSGAGESSPGKRFRLAGTFFVHPEDGTPDTRKAVLDDLKSHTQRIVGENDELLDGGVRVAQILRESVIIRGSDGQEEELRLGFSQGAGVARTGQEVGLAGTALNRYGGKQTGAQRWVFSRDSLLSYYQELRDNPQRLVKVFDSLKPLYDDSKRIQGYQLGIEGEAEFFAAAGMKEGDVVRKVNSAPMTSRRSAENYLRQFVNGKATVFVLDIERSGKPERLIYEISRPLLSHLH